MQNQRQVTTSKSWGVLFLKNKTNKKITVFNVFHFNIWIRYIIDRLFKQFYAVLDIPCGNLFVDFVPLSISSEFDSFLYGFVRHRG